MQKTLGYGHEGLMFPLNNNQTLNIRNIQNSSRTNSAKNYSSAKFCKDLQTSAE